MRVELETRVERDYHNFVLFDFHNSMFFQTYVNKKQPTGDQLCGMDSYTLFPLPQVSVQTEQMRCMSVLV